MTNKSSFYLAVALMPFAAVIARLRVAYDKHVPMGYEDENGFHLGPKQPLPRHPSCNHFSHENDHKMRALDFKEIHPRNNFFCFRE
jgi:hypothetical protein